MIKTLMWPRFLMVYSLAFSPLFLAQSALAENKDAQKIAELENRIMALEKAVTEKLGDCQMVYKHYSTRLNICDRGTFVRSVTSVGGDSYNLECGYYQLSCKRNP